MISAALQRLYQLAWQPGRWMHETWWQYLEVDQWQYSYRHYRVCQPAIDQLIITKRQFPPQTLPGELSEEETGIMMMEPKLYRVITALGLVALACQDYLLLGRYRRALAPQLGEGGCDQLLALYLSWDAGPATLSEDELVNASLHVGTQWLASQANNHATGQALLTLLPPVPPALPAHLPAGSVFLNLVKLARFL